MGLSSTFAVRVAKKKSPGLALGLVRVRVAFVGSSTPPTTTARRTPIRPAPTAHRRSATTAPPRTRTLATGVPTAARVSAVAVATSSCTATVLRACLLAQHVFSLSDPPWLPHLCHRLHRPVPTALRTRAHLPPRVRPQYYQARLLPRSVLARLRLHHVVSALLPRPARCVELPTGSMSAPNASHVIFCPPRARRQKARQHVRRPMVRTRLWHITPTRRHPPVLPLLRLTGRSPSSLAHRLPNPTRPVRLPTTNNVLRLRHLHLRARVPPPWLTSGSCREPRAEPWCP